MARILEALKQAETNRRRPTETLPVSVIRPPDPPSVVITEKKVEVPFIEVGGPGVILEASASVLAIRPAAKARSQTPSSAPASTPLPMPPAPAALPPTGPATVAFEPFAKLSQEVAAGNRLADELIAFHQPEHPLADSYRTLLACLARQWPAREPQVVLFTAAASGAAKTTVLLNLAITCARQGKPHLVVVDAGVGAPAVAERLGVPSAPGIREVLMGAVSLQSAIRKTSQDNLEVLTAGESSTGRLGGEPMKRVLRKLRNFYDLVLVDAPAWDGGPEILSLGAACDMAYLVVPQAEARTPEIEALLQELPKHGSRLGGCILTNP